MRYANGVNMKNKLSKKNVKCFIVIIGVIIVPLLYSYFYLGAFWDPYSRLETLPVAVVNNDAGATINEEQRNIGEEMCEQLEEDATLKFILTDEENAKKGTEGEDYYAMIVIPESFSQDIASASTTDKQTATIIYSPNEKRNYLASQILSRAVIEIEESTRASVNQEIVNSLADKLKAVPDQMVELQDGINQLYDGSTKLGEGTEKLAEGTATYNEKLTEYQKGITDVKDGSNKLKSGIATLDSGLQKLLDGANQLSTSTEKIDQISTGTQSLATGAETFNKSLIQYTTGVDALISSVSGTSNFLANYVTNVNPAIMKDPVFAGFMAQMSDPANAKSIQTLQAATTQLNAASQQIASGASTLAKGTTSLPQLKAAIAQLSAGLDKAKEGSAALTEGSQSLYTGLSTLDDATTKLSKAAADISNGADDLNDGAAEMTEGIDTAKAGIDTAITDANDELKVLDGLGEFAESPVNIEQTNVTTVPNYGTAFTPYFLSLSLWVGALIIFMGIYLDADEKFKILSRSSDRKVARSFIYLLIALIQAIVLAVVVKYGLGLEVSNYPLYIASCCLVSLVSISIVQFFMVHLKDLGKFLSIVLLILQLTSCGGTFPMETVPNMFRVLYPFMPMTYAVGLFKQAISGAVTSEVIYNGGILCLILVGFMTLTILFSVVKFKKAEKAENLIEETV